MLCRKPANKNASLWSNALWSANETNKTFWLVSKTLLQFDFLTILSCCSGSWIPRHLVGEGPQMSIHGCPFLSSALMCSTFSPIFHLSICLFMLSATSAESLRDDKTFLFYPEGLHQSYSCFDLRIPKVDEVLHKERRSILANLLSFPP